MVSRGEVYYIMPAEYTVGSEQMAGRPAIIVSNDKNNTYSSVVEVVYLTTQPKNDLPTHVTIRSTSRESTALCEQIQSVSAQRIGSWCAKCTQAEMDAVDKALQISLGINADNYYSGRCTKSDEPDETNIPPTHSDCKITPVPVFPEKFDYEKVDHPDHYQSEHGMECIDAMRVMFGNEAVLSFCRVTAYKYRFRAGLKPGEATEDDIAKAEWYEDYARKMLEGEV